MLTYIQGIGEIVFNLSTNSTVLNQWTSTTLALSGLLPKSDILHVVVSPSPTHTPRVARPITPQLLVGSHLRQAVIGGHAQSLLHPASGLPDLTLSTSCPQRLDCASLDSLQLTQMEIDAIRDLGRPGSGASSPGTPTSQMSQPDFVDPRPEIYRFVYDVSSGSRTPDSPSGIAEGGGSRLSELQGDDKYDEIVIDHRAALRHRLHTVTMRESGDTNETVPKQAYPNAECHSSSAVTECAVNESAVVSEPEAHVPAVSVTAAESSEVIMSAGNALISVPKNAEMTATVQDSVEKKHVTVVDTTPPSICTAEMPSAGPSQLQERPTASSRPIRFHKESFGSLLKNYSTSSLVTPLKIPTVEEIIQTLPHDATDRLSDAATPHSNTTPSSDDAPGTASVEPELQKVFESKSADEDNLLVFCNERGLSHQCYQCRGCTRPIGMFYGKERLCVFDGYYYCYECHENAEHTIPAYVVFNWDFRPYQVCKKSLEFLAFVNDAPLIDISEVNEHLYEHVGALHEALLLRTQLHSLQAYLFSCKQPVAEELLSKVSGKSYLLDSVHVYSLKDLTQVAAGTFAHRLKKAVDYGSAHVYSCILCSQKGFICELCHHPKVIYPFELTNTSRCESCKAVYHAQCKTKLVPCPRCDRRRSSTLSSSSSRRSDPIEHISFSFPADHSPA